jgi:hypothetical protein
LVAVRKHLYFPGLVAHFKRSMTRRSLEHFVFSTTILLAAQFPLRADTAGPALAKSAVLEGNVAYLRVDHVSKNLADEIGVSLGTLTASNQIAGAILDLRFAGGHDDAAAQAAENLFASQKRPLAILVNRETSGAAETLAADLRLARLGLIFDSTAGTAKSNSESTTSLQPDIIVTIGPEDERAFMNNPYALPKQSETNLPTATNNLLPYVDHTSEADLVRAKIKDGDELGFPTVQPAPARLKPFIRDPVLARAVDLIKGLAAVRRSS